jgi:transposase-like protein
MKCRHCGSEKCRKNGSTHGAKRCVCLDCGRSFSANPAPFSPEVNAQALQMDLNNVGIRKIALFVGASPAGVLKWIRKAAQDLSVQLQNAAKQVEQALPDVIERDEIDTYVQKNASERSFGLLILDDRAVLLRLK